MFSTPVGMTGNIATEPEISTTQDGKTFARFRLATSESQYVNGQWERSEAVFHQVSVFGKAAEAVQRTFTKGDRVAVVGTLKMETYADRGGNRRQGTTITADTVAADPLFTPVVIDRGPDAPAAGTDRGAAVEAERVARARDPHEQATSLQQQQVMAAQQSWQPQFGM